MHRTARRRTCCCLASCVTAVTLAQPVLAAGPPPVTMTVAMAAPARSILEQASPRPGDADVATIAEQLVALGYSRADAAAAAALLTPEDLNVLLACPNMMQNAGNSQSHTNGIILGALLLGGLIALAAAGDGSITTSF